MTIAKIIKMARIEHQLTQEEVAKKIGKTKNVISNWERGDNKPDLESTKKLCSLLDLEPNVLLNWNSKSHLHLSHDEENLISQYRTLPDWQQEAICHLVQNFYDHQSDSSEIIPTRWVPYYAISPSAGYGNYLDEDMDVETIKIQNTFENEFVDFIVKVDGHSMEPTFQNGQLVKVHKQNQISIGEIGIFAVNGNALIKELKKDRLHSLNSQYPDIIFHENMDIRCIGKVLGIYHS